MGRILLVEDDLELAVQLQGKLLSNGHSVALALNLDTALTKMSEERFDLVITDIFLCAQNAASPIGGQLIIDRANQIGESRQVPLPVIATSGGFHGNNLADWVLDTAEEMGAFARLTKPIDESALLAAVKEATQGATELVA